MCSRWVGRQETHLEDNEINKLKLQSGVNDVSSDLFQMKLRSRLMCYIPMAIQIVIDYINKRNLYEHEFFADGKTDIRLFVYSVYAFC